MTRREDVLLESRDWWREEADQRSHDYDRDLLLLSVCAAVIAVFAFWLGVLLG